MVACGALASHVDEIKRRRDWPVDVHPLPPLLHNHPDRIAPAVFYYSQELNETFLSVYT